jgi:hypothetical protein
MKRFSVVIVVLCACLAPLAWAQKSTGLPNRGPRGLRDRIMNGMPQTQTHGANGNLSFYGQASRPTGLKTWDLGSAGTWVNLFGINNLGVAVGCGDVGSDPLRMVGVSLFGLNAGKWFDGGVSSSDNDWWMVEAGRISDTGLIVGGIAGEDGWTMAHVWVPNQPGFDLGKLEGDTGSVAIDINRSGTLIVGLSFLATETNWGSTPVAWTPDFGWHQGKLAVTWKIHRLSTNGMEKPGAVYTDGTLDWWGAWGVNDRGQIVGDAWSDDYSNEIAVVWNPMDGGHDWKVQQLPHQSTSGFVSDHYWTEAIGINNQGEIAGDVSIDVGPGGSAAALWRMSPRTHTWEMTELPTLLGMRFGRNAAYGINEAGDLVGWSTPASIVCCSWDSTTNIAARWQTKDPGFVKAIGFAGDWSEAMGVNNSGIAVGYYSSNGGPTQGFAAAIR